MGHSLILKAMMDPPCEETEDCLDICGRWVSSSRRSKCKKSPQDLVKAMEDGIWALLNIDDVDSLEV